MEISTLLIVDDEENILNFLNYSLQDVFEIYMAESGPAAMEILGRQKIDLILTDERMPGMTAFELLKEASNLQPGVVGVIMSAINESAVVTDGLNPENVRGYIQKPLNIDQMRSRLLEVALRQRAYFDQQLLENGEKFFKIFHLNRIAMALSTIREGRFIEANSEFLRIAGHSREEVIGSTALELNLWVQPDQRSQVFLSITEQGGLYNQEFEIRTKSGEVLALSWTAETIKINDVPCLLSTVVDISERKRVNEAAARESAFFSQLIDDAPEAIVLLDNQDCVQRINREFTRVFGYGAVEASGKPINDLLAPPHLLEEAIEQTRKAARGEKIVLESARRRKDGSLVFVSILGSPIFSNGEQAGILVIYRDISQEKLTEAIMSSRSRLLHLANNCSLHELLEATLDEAEILTSSLSGFYHFVEADQKTLWLQAWSTNTRKNLCKAEGEGQHNPVDKAGVWVDCIRERRPVIHNDYASLPHRKGMPEGHAPVIRELVIPVMRDDRIVAVLGVGNKPTLYNEQDIHSVMSLADLAWDIAVRKRAEDALKENEAKYRIVAENTYDWEYWLDVDERFVYCSPSCENLTGHTQKEFMQDAGLLSRIIHPGDQAIVRRQECVLEMGKPSQIEFRIIRPDNSIRWIGQVCNPVYDDRGVFMGYRGSNRDITRRKESEEALRIKSQAIETAINAIAFWDVDGLLTYVNPAFLRMWGYTDERDVLGKPTISFWQVQGRADEVVNTLEKTGAWTGEMVGRHRDGFEFIAQVSTSRVVDKDDSLICMQASFVDLSEHKQYETRIEKRNLELNLLYEAGRQISQTLELQTIYLLFFQQISSIMKCDNLFIADFEQKTGMITARFAVNEGNLLDVSVFPPIPLEPEGHGIQSPVIRSGKARKINDYALALKNTNTNYYIDEDNQVCTELELDDDAKRTQSALIIPILLNERVQGVIQIQSVEKNAYIDDDLLIAESLVAQIAVASNNARLYHASLLEISERRKAEEKVVEAQAELKRLLAETEESRKALLSLVEDQKASEERIIQLNRDLEIRVSERTVQLEAANQELQAFAYSVSHDLRGPLRSMNGFSTLLLEDYGSQLDEQAISYVGRIQEGSRRMDQLIKDLLNLSLPGLSQFTLQKVDISALAVEIVQNLINQNKQRQFEIKIADGLFAEADTNLIKIALENLLHNAFKFTGKCDLAVIQVDVMEQNGEQVYFVRDNGAGFDMANAEKIFAPGQRLHGGHEYPGTGIGLSIVQRIITRHGGRIWTESHVGQGTTFYFTLGGAG